MAGSGSSRSGLSPVAGSDQSRASLEYLLVKSAESALGGGMLTTRSIVRYLIVLFMIVTTIAICIHNLY